jgi:N-acetylneuraminic acid mutarotase
VTTATISWPKVTFDAWWASRKVAFSSAIAAPSARFSFAVPHGAACVDDTWETTDIDAPDPREYHTAVWTGAEMIVWGGGYSEVVNTGGRYNPATDTWIATQNGPDTPSARWHHSAVWTGTEMIVWGGKDAIGFYTNTGGRYDPMTNTWRPMQSGGAPTERIHASMFWTGTKVLIWGGDGCVPGCQAFKTGGLYDPLTDIWSSMNSSSAPTARYGYTAVWTGSSMIVWGGYDGSPSVRLKTGGRYDPATDTWLATSTGANVPTARYGHAAVWTGTEMIVWGGSTSTGSVVTGARYNPASNMWFPTSTGAGVPAARSDESSVWTGHRMIVWGGRGAQSDLTNTGGQYDPSLDAWTPMNAGPTAPSPRSSHSAVWTGTEMIVWGGQSSTEGLTATGARYDPDADTWIPTSMGTTPTGCSSREAVWTGTEMIVWGCGHSYASLNQGGRYDPMTDTWTPTSVGANVPIGRAGATAVWTGTEMIVWGGNTDIVCMNTGGRYSPLTDSWRPTSVTGSTPIPRRDHTAVWTGREMIVWGGLTDPYNFTGMLSSGGRYDPDLDSWTATAQGSTTPSRRAVHTAVFMDGVMIVWGGSPDGYYTNTGGRYDPSMNTWTPTSVAAGVPQGRFSHTAVVADGKMIVWGGVVGGGTNTGGAYDPQTDSWTATNADSPDAPVERYSHAAVWTGREMIVWGGTEYATADQLNSGGRYDPALDSWTPTSLGVNVPPPRQSPSAVWTGTEMIVWGGFESTTSTGGRYCACPLGRLVYRDADGDGFGDPGNSAPTCDGSIPAGYVLDATDCDDANASVYPGAPELCNGIDDNCDGTIDEGFPQQTYYRDADGDTFGDPAAALSACATPPHYVSNNADCDDSNAAVHPGGIEVCNGVDDDCDGTVDNGGNALCATGIPCFVDTCQGAARCSHVRATNGTVCDDGNACTRTDVCQSGLCVGANPVACSASDQCHVAGSCNPATGSCSNPAAPDGTTCDDGNACTAGDACRGGACTGSPVSGPGEIDNSVTVALTDADATISWNPAPTSTTSSVVRGLLTTLPVGSAPASETCLTSRLPISSTTWSDSDLPSPGDGFWYLVRGENACGIGPYGFEGANGVPTLPESSAACP